MSVPFLNEIIILFLLSIVVTMACARLRLPATVGFLVTGVLCGPSLLGVVSDLHTVDVLAELGVALLLFTIGMEMSGEVLSRIKKPVFIGGSLQILLTIGAITAIFVWEKESIQYGIFCGCLVALSSSAIVLRLLQQRGATATPHGRLSLAILVFQDILVAPMLLAVPLLAGKLVLSWENVIMATLQVVGVLGGVLLFARFGLSRLMEAVIRTRIRELLLLTTLGLCLGMAMLTASLGLSLSLGAFLAGLLLARSEYSMSVVSGILPYRDVFMSLFFISTGMLLDVHVLYANFGLVLYNVALFILIKTLLTLPAVLVQGYPLRTAIITSLCLAQAGEFAFVLAAKGVSAGLFTTNDYQIFLAVSIITMMLTPGIIAGAPRAAAWTVRLLGRSEEEAASGEEVPHLTDHLIIVGFGISGKHLAHVARETGIPYEILEMNPDTVARFRGQEPISYGDASQPAVLEHLGVKEARVLTIVISDPAAVRSTIAEARNLNPNLHIVARTRFLGEVEPLRHLGANDVIAEEFESSIEVFSRVLGQYLVPQQDINAFSERIRKENYAMFRSLNEQADSLGILVNQMPDVGVRVLRLEDGAPLAGQTLFQTALRQQYSVTVVAYNRKGTMYPSPDGSYVFQPDDVIYLFGDNANLHDIAPQFCHPAKGPAHPVTA